MRGGGGKSDEGEDQCGCRELHGGGINGLEGCIGRASVGSIRCLDPKCDGVAAKVKVQKNVGQRQRRNNLAEDKLRRRERLESGTAGRERTYLVASMAYLLMRTELQTPDSLPGMSS